MLAKMTYCLILPFLLISCVTVNHGYTNRQGSIELGVDGGYLQNSESKSTSSTFFRPFMKYGIAEDVTIGLNTGVYSAGQNAGQANGVSAFGLKSFSFDNLMLCLGIGIDLYSDSSKNSITSPSASGALSLDISWARPFVGVYSAGGIVEGYGGVDLDFHGLRPSLTVGVYRSSVSSPLLTSANSQAVYFLVPGLSYVF